jgi:hypothetical protein
VYRRCQVTHEAWCQQKAFNHSDAAKRVSDTYNLHRIALGYDAIGKWFGSALNDGRSDDTLYDSKRDCVVHQHHNEMYYTYTKIGPQSMNPCEAEVMLKTARSLYDKGLRLADPDHARGGLDVIKRLTVEDQLAQARGINTNLRMPWEA